jgi:hypothetical protein
LPIPPNPFVLAVSFKSFDLFHSFIWTRRLNGL